MSEYIEMLREEARFCGDYVTLSKDDVLAMLGDYAALEARVAELEKDAARYRWLRENCLEQVADDDVGPYLYHGAPWNCNWRRDLDDAVDEAISREA